VAAWQTVAFGWPAGGRVLAAAALPVAAAAVGAPGDTGQTAGS